MSIEERLADLTAAVKENSELLKFLTSKAREGVAGNAPAKGAEKGTEKGDDKAKPTRSRASSKKEKVPSAKDMSEATKKFLDVDSLSEDEYDARRDLVLKIVEKFGVKKMSEIDEADRLEALGMIEAYKAGDDPFEGDEEQEENDLA